jgi:hypothetical protein
MREFRVVAIAVAATLAIGADGAVAAGRQLVVPVTSGDQVGLAVKGKPRGGSVAALFGMWSDDGALELGGFREGAPVGVDPNVARAAAIMAGRSMRSTGVKLSGSFHRSNGLSMTVEARRQQVSDIGAALGGDWRTTGDTRLTLGGKLKF